MRPRLLKSLFWSKRYTSKLKPVKVKDLLTLDVKTSYNWFLSLNVKKLSEKRINKYRSYRFLRYVRKEKGKHLNKKLRQHLSYTLVNSNLFSGEEIIKFSRPDRSKNEKLLNLVERLNLYDNSKLFTLENINDYPLTNSEINYIKTYYKKFKFYYLSNYLKCL